MNRLRMFVLALAAACCLAAPAPAQSWGETETVCTDGLFIRAAQDAEAYWTKRGFTFGTPVKVYTLRDSSGASAWGTLGDDDPLTDDNEVWWSDVYQRNIREQIKGRRWMQRLYLSMVFTVAIHERGHNLGFHHSEDPKSVMFPSLTLENRPPMAIKWARLVVAENQQRQQ